MLEVKLEDDQESVIFRTRRRTRRSKDEIQKDVVLYNELIQRNKHLEKDIPPKRMVIKKESVKANFRRLKSKKPIVPTVSKSIPLVRPKFKNKPFTKPASYKSKKITPPKLAQSKSNNFEHKVQIDNQFSSLIDLVNSNIDKNPESSNIDISLHYNFVKKNLNQEDEKFRIENSSQNDLLEYKSFNRDDIDLFFKSFDNSFNQKPDLRNTSLV